MILCPYCQKWFYTDYEFEQDESWREECPGCEKTFLVEGSYIIYYTESRADCLNGLAEHDFQKIGCGILIPDKLRCTLCGEEKPI